MITDATPIGRADIVFSFDLTGSMGDVLSTAKSNAVDIMTAVDSEVPDAQFGVVSYMDDVDQYNSFGYSNTYGVASRGDYPYNMDNAITNNKAAISSAINGLSLGYGSDGPEGYTRVFYESYADTTIGYRTGAKKIFINFADDIPHDNNLNEDVPGKTGIYTTGGNPGRNGVMDETSDSSKIGVGNDDLDLQTVLQEMKNNDITLLEVQSSSSKLEYWTHWTGITGGNVYQIDDSAEVKNAILSLVSDVVSNIDALTLEVEPGYESWVSWTPESYTDVKGSETKQFDVTITVPAGTASGEYNFKIHLVADGAILASQDVKITVPGESSPAADIPEFPTVILPMAAIMGLAFVFMRRK
ncbi:PEF-CTERM sorting domain-containing protein [Methanolobus sp. ZRKC5]|uniref:PEF-CTERM sorting domain-containing protein n=1 Tax=unclassified Methanolobus TaxID=2629569 RepID=UPI00313CECB2